MVRTRFGKLHNLWADRKIHFNLRLRLYKSCVCIILTYGSEAWTLDEKTAKKLNGANSQMLSVISGRTQQEQASPGKSFDLV